MAEISEIAPTVTGSAAQPGTPPAPADARRSAVSSSANDRPARRRTPITASRAMTTVAPAVAIATWATGEPPAGAAEAAAAMALAVISGPAPLAGAKATVASLTLA